MHVDGDSFFASCEMAKDPSLRGRPVVTGQERGIVSSMNYEARRLGIRRAMPLHDIARTFPEAVILPSDYETYSIVSQRMYGIVRRYTPVVEEYSIDECFADLTGLRRVHHKSYEALAAAIKADMERELGMTFSMGLSATKTLAKLGSRHKKPAGLTAIRLIDAPAFLSAVPIEKVWGIGPNTSAHLQKLGIRSAREFTMRSEQWVKAHCSKPYVEIWHELQGRVANELDARGRDTYHSISKTKTFTPPSRDARFVFAELSKNIENACIKARRWGLATKEVFFFLKTKDFRYHGCEVRLSHPTAIPQEILREVARHFPQLFRADLQYRATGISLMKLSDARTVQLDLFGAALKSEGLKRVFESVDDMSARYGKHIVFLASSLKTMERRLKEGERGGPSTRTGARFQGETFRRRLGVAFWGEVG
jgi:DNA polymerase-4/DNA polymerase V